MESISPVNIQIKRSHTNVIQLIQCQQDESPIIKTPKTIKKFNLSTMHNNKIFDTHQSSLYQQLNANSTNANTLDAPNPISSSRSKKDKKIIKL